MKPTSVDNNAIAGQCHCGNINYELLWPVQHTLIGRACGCDYCSMQGAIWTSHAEARLRLCYQQPEAVLTYRFGHRTAAFNICARCGIVPVATCSPQQQLVAVININTFLDLDIASIPRQPTNFEAESSENRLQRRQRNWTPVHLEID